MLLLLNSNCILLLEPFFGGVGGTLEKEMVHLEFSSCTISNKYIFTSLPMLWQKMFIQFADTVPQMALYSSVTNDLLVYLLYLLWYQLLLTWVNSLEFVSKTV